MSQPDAKRPSPPNTPEVLELFGQLQDRVEQLKTWQIMNDRYVQDLHERAIELENRQAALDRATKHLSRRRERVARLRRAVRQRRVQLEELGEKQDHQGRTIEDARKSLAAVLGPHIDIERQRQQLDDDRAEFEKERKLAIDSGESEATDRLAQREAELSSKLVKYREKTTQLKARLVLEREQVTKKTEALEKRSIELDQKAAALERINAQFKRRRATRKKYRALLHERSKALRAAESNVQSTRQQYEGMLQQRQVLLDVKQFLASSEAEMVRRWATHKSGALVMGIVLTVISLAGLGYGVGQRVVEPVWRATTVLEVMDQPDHSDLNRWAAEHRGVMLSDPVLRETMSQLDQRGVKVFETTQLMAQQLSQTLLARPAGDGQLELECRHTDRELVVSILEAMGRAYLGYRMAIDRAEGRSNSVKIVQAALRDTKPVEDLRLPVAAVTFGVGLGVTTLLALVMRMILLRAKRVFDRKAQDALPAIDAPDAWPEPPQVDRATDVTKLGGARRQADGSAESTSEIPSRWELADQRRR